MRHAAEKLPPEKGVYVLVLRSEKAKSIRVGRLGTMNTEQGYYAYIGSAFGAGGLKSRLGRHLKTAKKCRWHIDYIRRHMSAAAVWFTTDAVTEHEIAGQMIKMGGAVHMPGFGSSDCRCCSHLFYFEKLPKPLLNWHLSLIEHI